MGENWIITLLEECVSQLSSRITFAELPSELEAKLKNVTSNLRLPRGDYLVPFEIIISQGGTLEIEPGTRIAHSGILAYGCLKVEGTINERTSFIARVPNKENIPRNITFAGEFSNDSILRYCDIMGGCGRYEIPEKGEFKGCFLGKDSHGGGVLIYSSNAIVEYCLIQYNKADRGGAAHLENCQNPGLKNNIVTFNYAEEDRGDISLFKSDPAIVDKNKRKGNITHCGGVYIVQEGEGC